MTKTQREWDKRFEETWLTSFDKDRPWNIKEYIYQRDAAIRAETIKEIVGMIEGKRNLLAGELEAELLNEHFYNGLYEAYTNILDHLKEQLEGKA